MTVVLMMMRGGRGKKKCRSECNVSLGNRDLSNIVIRLHFHEGEHHQLMDRSRVSPHDGQCGQ